MIIIVEADIKKTPEVLEAIRRALNSGNWYDFVEIHPGGKPLQLSDKFKELWDEQ